MSEMVERVARARGLIAAGIPDQPWEVPGRIGGPSIAWMADRAIDPDGGYRKFRPFLGLGNPKSGGSREGGATLPPEIAQDACTARPRIGAGHPGK